MKSYVRGPYAKAACSLIDELKRLGVSACVGYRVRKRERTLIVEITKGDRSAVPTEWQGFRVETEH